jgi:DUF177 domain-containing protein
MTLAAIDIRDLTGRPGASREETIVGTIDALATELVSVPVDAPVEAALLLESIVEGVLVTGRLAGTWRLRCARCLIEFDGTFDIDVHELFVPHPDEDDDDYPLDPEGLLDANQMARDAIGVEMPFSPLCRSDCRGLCPICGGNRNLGECPGHDEVDPRFAVLSELFPELTDDDRPRG